MTIEEFRATGKDVDNLQDYVDYLDGPTPGRIYDGKLHIEAYEDRYCLLIVGNTQQVGELAGLEEKLYEWAESEGYWA